jgi:hypothetical protein
LTAHFDGHGAVSNPDSAGTRINVNPRSVWNFSPPDAFLIVNTMRSTSMNDDVHFGELQHAFAQPENEFFLSQDHSAQYLGTQDRSLPGRPAHHGQKAITEMVIGAWYLDEFGNPTREIKARD